MHGQGAGLGQILQWGERERTPAGPASAWRASVLSYRCPPDLAVFMAAALCQATRRSWVKVPFALLSGPISAPTQGAKPLPNPLEPPLSPNPGRDRFSRRSQVLAGGGCGEAPRCPRPLISN